MKKPLRPDLTIIDDPEVEPTEGMQAFLNTGIPERWWKDIRRKILTREEYLKLYPDDERGDVEFTHI